MNTERVVSLVSENLLSQARTNSLGEETLKGSDIFRLLTIRSHLDTSIMTPRILGTLLLGGNWWDLCFPNTHHKPDFNPKPFIRAFEGATEQLDTKRREVAAQVAAIDAQVKSDSLTHETDTDRQRSTTQELFQIFEDLDQRLSDVSNAAMRIGRSFAPVVFSPTLQVITS